MSLVILFGSFIVMCIFGVPLAVSMVLSSLLVALIEGIPLIAMVQQMYLILDSYTLLAVPLFLMLGHIMEYGKLTEQLINLSDKLVGHIRGGLAHVNIFATMISSAIIGSAVASTVATGTILIPSMKKQGYSPEFSAAINGASSVVGPIIPPSIMMVVYASYSGLSVSALFLAGFVPGFIITVFLMLYVYIWAVRTNFPVHGRRSTLKEIFIASRQAVPALLAPVFIFGGVVGGIVTATEAGMVAAVYCFIITGFLFKMLNLKVTWKVMRNTLESMAQPLLCVAAAGPFGFILAYLRVPQMIIQYAGGLADSYLGVLIFIAILYIILGTFMDATPAIIIFMPIIQALTRNVGANPLHIGILIVTTMCLGFMTPPYGLTLLVSAGIADVEPIKVIREAKWIYLIYFVIVVLLMFAPELFLFLPRLFMPGNVP